MIGPIIFLPIFDFNVSSNVNLYILAQSYISRISCRVYFLYIYLYISRHALDIGHIVFFLIICVLAGLYVGLCMYMHMCFYIR